MHNWGYKHAIRGERLRGEDDIALVMVGKQVREEDDMA